MAPKAAWVTDVTYIATDEGWTYLAVIGDCWDNAVAESFFAMLRAELVDHERYPTRAAAVASIGEYIDELYNLVRRHSCLRYISPIELELRTQPAVLAA